MNKIKKKKKRINLFFIFIISNIFILSTINIVKACETCQFTTSSACNTICSPKSGTTVGVTYHIDDGKGGCTQICNGNKCVCSGDDDDDDSEKFPVNICTWDDKCSVQYRKTQYDDECSTDADCNNGGTCDCGSWTSHGCGSPCNSDQMYSTRTCTPAGCDSESKCEYSSSCADPCAGVNCGSCRYCSGGNCYYYCSGTSSSCGCTSCVSCGSCRYCSGTSCSNYCSGTDTSCGCTSCTNCNSKDKCNGPYYDDYHCSGTSCVLNTHTLNTVCAGLKADVAAVSNFYNKSIPVVLLNISNPFSLANGKLTLSVRNEGGALMGSCSQTISLSNKLFFGTAVKDAHFYQWAESILLTEEEIAECQESGMSSYMYDYCKHHDCTEESFNNYGEADFYKKYPGLKILENTLNYLPSSSFVNTPMPDCESLFKSLSVGFYDLTASLEVIP